MDETTAIALVDAALEIVYRTKYIREVWYIPISTRRTSRPSLALVFAEGAYTYSDLAEARDIATAYLPQRRGSTSLQACFVDAFTPDEISQEMRRGNAYRLV